MSDYFEVMTEVLQERIAPGIWIDGNGNPHISVTELMELAELPDTPENRAAVTEIARQVIRQSRPGAEIIERSRRP